MPHHEASARVAIWYPSTAQDAPALYADNPVFQGVEAHLDGPVSEGQHPVVLFSHGIGGTDRAQAWLGAALAERGVITVAINHPNSTWGNFDMSKGVAHWTRAQDVSAAFDALLDLPDFAERIDPSRVMAAGFSFGGWTALSLGGARGNLAGMVEACTTYPEMEACALLMSEEVNMPELDPADWNQSYADARVTHVMAIDPGFVWGLTASDVADLLSATRVIGFGGEEDRMLATDFDRSGLAGLLGDGKTLQFDPAYHFSAMPLCKPAGEAILAEEKDDPVCTDPEGSDRAAIHDKIVNLIANDLGL
jgi:predicted dienelactone hydrolase